MSDIVEILQASSENGVLPEDVDIAIEEITRLRARVQELEAGGEVAGYLCSHKMQRDLGTWFSRFDQSDEYIVATPVYTAPQPASDVVKDAERLDFITAAESTWLVQWKKKPGKPVRYRMIEDGEPWGRWHTTARAAIDAAMKGGEK